MSALKNKIIQSSLENTISLLTPEIIKKSNCNIIQLPIPSSPPPSNYTSQGKRKSSKCDPITNPEDIERMKNFYLNTGHKNKRLRNYMIFVLGVSLGLRGCDLLRLQIRDVLNPNGTIKNRITTFESKTSKTNYPYVNNTAKTAILQYLESLSEIHMDDYLIKDPAIDFATEPMCEDTLNKTILKASKALNLPYHLGAHSLRKTFSYWTIKLHPNDTQIMITLQEMLNHSSMRTTLRYAGITDEDHNKVYNDIGDFLNKPSNCSYDSIEADISALEPYFV